MTRTGAVRRMFPGGNTSLGFYSFYDNVIGPEARRVFILKGGPGAGQVHLHDANRGPTGRDGL